MSCINDEKTPDDKEDDDSNGNERNQFVATTSIMKKYFSFSVFIDLPAGFLGDVCKRQNTPEQSRNKPEQPRNNPRTRQNNPGTT